MVARCVGATLRRTIVTGRHGALVELRYTCVSTIHAIQPGVHTSLYVWYAAANAVLKLEQL